MATNKGFTGWSGIRSQFRALYDLADRVELDACPAICQIMRETAVTKLTQQGAVDTGNLRNSVESRECEFIMRQGESIIECGIRTNVHYAPFIEYGTGPLGDPAVPHTTKNIWFQYNPDYNPVYGSGDAYHRDMQWIPRFPQRPRPFMRPALYDNTELFKAILRKTVTDLWG